MITKVKSNAKHWKLVSVVIIIILFFSLFGYIFLQSIQLPSEGWSRGILINSYDVSTDHSQLTSNNTVALSLSDKSIVSIYTNDMQLVINKHSIKGELLGSKIIPFKTKLSSVYGYLREGNIKLLVHSKSNSKAYSIDLNQDDFDIKSIKEHSLKGYDVTLSNELIIAHSKDEVRVISDDNQTIVKEKLTGFIELADAMIYRDNLFISTVYNDRGTHKLGNLYADGEKIDRYIYPLSPINSIRPINLMLNENNGELELLVTMHNLKKNSKYLEYFNIGLDSRIKNHELITDYSYDATPYIVDKDDTDLYIYNLYTRSLARTEIDRGRVFSPNLFITSTIKGLDKTQLTNTPITCYQPSYLTIDGYDYLIYTEYGDGKASTFMSSNNPDIIKLSQKTTSGDLLNLTVQTLLNYPVILFTSITASIPIIFPVILIAGILLILKLHWFDDDKRVSSLLLIIYTISKVTVYAYFIFSEHLFAQSLPGYLIPAINHWGMFILLSLITAYISWNRLKTSTDRSNYLRELIIYIIIDITVINLFFLPYKII